MDDTAKEAREEREKLTRRHEGKDAQYKYALGAGIGAAVGGLLGLIIAHYWKPGVGSSVLDTLYEFTRRSMPETGELEKIFDEVLQKRREAAKKGEESIPDPETDPEAYEVGMADAERVTLKVEVADDEDTE